MKTTVNVPQPDEIVKLNLNDFTSVINIIDVCTKRGAFEGGELLLIGQLRQKFAMFIEQNTAAAKQAEDAQKQTPVDFTNRDNDDV